MDVAPDGNLTWDWDWDWECDWYGLGLAERVLLSFGRVHTINKSQLNCNPFAMGAFPMDDGTTVINQWTRLLPSFPGCHRCLCTFTPQLPGLNFSAATLYSFLCHAMRHLHVYYLAWLLKAGPDLQTGHSPYKEW